jgi:hypothetical protein
VVTVEHIRGDTLSIGVAETSDATGLPVDLTGFTITAQVRDALDAVLADLDVTIDEPRTLGTYELGKSAATTATWAPGSYVCDIRRVSAGALVEHTDKFVLRVVAEVTR